MTDFPSGTDLETGPVGSGGSSAQEVHDWLVQLAAAVAQLPGASDKSELTIAAGVVAPAGFAVQLDTEADAASDDLTHLDPSGLPEGSIVCLEIVDSGRKVTLKHQSGGSGQLFLSGAADLTLKSTSQRVWLRLDGSQWVEDGRSYGNQLADMRAWLGLGAASTYAVASLAEVQAGTASDKLITVLRLAEGLADAGLMIGGRNEITAPALTAEVLLNVAGALRRCSLANLPIGIPAPGFASGELSVSLGTVSTPVTHDLGATPKLVNAHLICKTASSTHGYAVGAIIPLSTVQGIGFRFDATHFKYFIRSSGFIVQHEDNTGDVTISAGFTSHFRLVVAAWK